MAIRTATGIGLCAGVGWLDEAVRLAWEFHGVEYRTLVYCEREVYPASVLMARMEDSSIHPAAVCDSIEDIGPEFRGTDCIVAGFPCQPWSCAGSQKGADDERWLWGVIEDCIRTVEPEWLFLENVAGFASGDIEGGALDDESTDDLRGLSLVSQSLAEMGFDAEWGHLTASSVGASHKRERWFCVAKRRHGVGEVRTGRDSAFDAGCGDVAHRNERGQQEQRRGGILDGERAAQRDDANGCNSDLADPPQRGQRELRQPSGGNGQPDQAGALARDAAQLPSDAPIFAPGPADPRWTDILRDSPHLAPAIEPGFRLHTHGSPVVVDESRADQLRCSGNGVVALQAACAYSVLLSRLGG